MDGDVSMGPGVTPCARSMLDEWWLLSGLSAAIISTVCKASRDDAYVGDTVAAGALAAICLVRR